MEDRRNPTVTVGIPFYNSRATLADAVRSVFAQTYQDWELVLLDDGSTDGSIEIVEGISDSRVRVLRDEANRGLPTRLNEIAEVARGEFLARMDADDLMHPERLERQVEYLKRSKCSVVGTAMYSIGADGSVQGVRGLGELDQRPASVLLRGLLAHPTIMGRKDWFRRHPYDARLTRAEDHELWVRTLGTTCFARLDMPLYFYREVLGRRAGSLLLTYKTSRRILLAYGPAMIGWRRTALHYCESLVKTALVPGLVRLGDARWLIRRRNRPVGEQQRLEAEMALRRVCATPVPGLRDQRVTPGAHDA